MPTTASATWLRDTNYGIGIGRL